MIKNYYIFLIDNVLYNSKNGQNKILDEIKKTITSNNIVFKVSQLLFCDILLLEVLKWLVWGKKRY